MKTILIVDDHLVVKAGVSIILNNEIKDLKISFSSNYCETLKLIKKKKYDLIILDINIPGGKSTEMIAEIKSFLPNVKILMFSAYEEESYALRYIHAGANGYLNKLSSEEKIVEAVNSIFEKGCYLTDDLVEILNNNHTVIIADNLCNSKAETINKINN